ncbi:DMT family protein [Spirulina sp. 06S082]|nr:DMT family protein [Spirulina sp. 06S082]
MLLTEKIHHLTDRYRLFVVPAMLFSSSMIMTVAWLGHLKFKQLPLFWAILFCWLLVLPEYFVNISAIRLGYNLYTGAQMAAFRLCSGVICIALVSRFLLGEELNLQKLTGFGLMIIAMILITRKSPNVG